MESRHIVAIGGADFAADPDDSSLYHHILNLCRRSRPQAAFLPQASGESRGYVHGFQRTFESLGASTSWLSLFAPPSDDLRCWILEQDLIYVGGGNTKSMLALWREWGLDLHLREAWEGGTVLAGLSAGSICWFEQGSTDSIPGRLSPLPGLGILSGSFCPHYDSEVGRRPDYLQKVSSGELKPGYAAEDGAAVHFMGTEFFEAVASRQGKRAFRVELSGITAQESPLRTRYLGP